MTMSTAPEEIAPDVEPFRTPDEELLDDLRRVAAETAPEPPRATDYDDLGEYCYATILRRIGPWRKALREAGIECEPRSVPVEDLLEDVRRVAAETAPRAPRVADYEELGRHGHGAIYRRFDSWPDALERAGVEAGPSEGEVVRDVARVYHGLGGRRPSRREYREHGEHGPSTVATMFGMGDWARAMDELGI